MLRWLIADRVRLFLLAIPVVGLLAFVVSIGVTRLDLGKIEPLPPTPAAAAPSTAVVPAATPTPTVLAGLLDGERMTQAEWDARKGLAPLAIMIDNAPGAYPQSGLDKADLVYEAFVEGGITRFMAVFWSQEAPYVEPVRSARTPFVIWADELGALYGHAGSAATDNEANAAGQIADWGVKDLNAFDPEPSSAYYRDDTRYAPHNLVGDTAALRKVAGQLGYTSQPALARWTFKDDGAGTTSAKPAGGIQVDFGGDLYSGQTVQWKWDPASHSYLRYQWGGPAVDGQTKQQLRFTNVVVMRVPWQVVDDSGHVLLDQIGRGPASVFLDGKEVDGTWRKDDRTSRTRFYDGSGVEIPFNRGPIFIEVVGPDSGVVTAPAADGLPPLPAYEPFDSTVPQGADATDSGDMPGPTATPSVTATARPSTTATASPSASVAPPKTPLPTATAVPTKAPPASPTATGR